MINEHGDPTDDPPKFRIRPFVVGDEPFLWDMLYTAVHVRDGDEPPPRSVIEEPNIAHYLVDLGRPGDDVRLAVSDAGERIGAAWCRLMPPDDPGYGYVAPDIPEVSMAVVEEWRGRGVGTRLLLDLLARNPTMSLSVDDENTGAERLYARLGFAVVRTDGTSRTMLRRPGAS